MVAPEFFACTLSLSYSLTHLVPLQLLFLITRCLRGLWFDRRHNLTTAIDMRCPLRMETHWPDCSVKARDTRLHWPEIAQTDWPQSIGMSIVTVVGGSERSFCKGVVPWGPEYFWDNTMAGYLGTLCRSDIRPFSYSISDKRICRRSMSLASTVGPVRATASLPTLIVKP